MIRSTKKSNTEEFILKSLNKHGDKYDYSKVEYVGNKNKVIIICPKHGEFLQRPNDHLTGYGCKKCQYEKNSQKNKFTYETFIEKAKQIHGNRFDYSLVKYNGYENKIIIICSKHGEFEQTPHSHLNGAGCRKCRASHNEEKIANILLKHNINFKREITFNNLKDESNLYYDFYLPKYKIFIEYDGKQHYKPIKFFGGENALLKTRKHDIIKIKYAINNGCKLIKIPYSIISTVEEALLCELKNNKVLC
jgi:very-short-patch-repair endonuclease